MSKIVSNTSSITSVVLLGAGIFGVMKLRRPKFPYRWSCWRPGCGYKCSGSNMNVVINLASVHEKISHKKTDG